MNNIKITATKLILLLLLFDSRANYSFFLRRDLFRRE